MLKPALNYTLQPSRALQGTINLPGDKSISHRALMLAAIAEGQTTIDGFLFAKDTLATMHALKQLGVSIDEQSETQIVIEGVGLHGLQQSATPLELGNSGTSIRLLAGLLAAQDFSSVLQGDQYLNRRPMSRIVAPLTQMGALIKCEQDNYPPMQISGGQNLHAIDYTQPQASAQVKSALLLAGLYAKGTTTIHSPLPSRDHTERMLQAFKCKIEEKNNAVSITGGQTLHATQIDIPADFSSAAFFIVGACIAPGSEITLPAVGINPTRTGCLNILNKMGANIELKNQRLYGLEPVADICVRYAPLKAVQVSPDEVPATIDEFPALFIASACADGVSEFYGLQELAFKESNRLQAMAAGLRQLGVEINVTQDHIAILGRKTWSGARIDSCHDHRIAMAFAMAALRASSPIYISNCENVATSLPKFVDLAKVHGLAISVEEV